MKRPLFMVAVLIVLAVGCAPAVSDQGNTVVGAMEQVPATPANNQSKLASSAPLGPPASPTASSPTDTFTLTPIPTPTSSPSSAASTAASTPATNPTAAPTLDSTPVPQDGLDTDELVSHGLEVYRQQYCGVCHQLSAAGTGGMFGPTHDGMGATAEQRLQASGYSGGATTPGEYIYESLIAPKAYLVPGYEVTSHHMPAYTHLEQADLEALVQMLLQQR